MTEGPRWKFIGSEMSSNKATPDKLLAAGFKLAWDSCGQKCYSMRATKRVSMFFIFREDASISRAGMTTDDGVIFPLDVDADMNDIVAAQRIFRAKGV